MKQAILLGFLFLGLNTYSQTQYQNKSGIYSFEVPDSYKKQISTNDRNEFVFTNSADTTSLVVNVNITTQTKENTVAFKKATNSQVESIYFKVLKDPRIVKRGDLLTYKDQSIYFHVKHSASAELENDYMLTYLFYHKGKEINFIFRTKERRLESIIPVINAIVNSVKLL